MPSYGVYGNREVDHLDLVFGESHFSRGRAVKQEPRFLLERDLNLLRAGMVVVDGNGNLHAVVHGERQGSVDVYEEVLEGPQRRGGAAEFAVWRVGHEAHAPGRNGIRDGEFHL